MTDDKAISKGLTEAQRRAVKGARWREEDGAWYPEGWYCTADKRVCVFLCRLELTRDYLKFTDKLTDLGLAVRNRLERRSNDRR